MAVFAPSVCSGYLTKASNFYFAYRISNVIKFTSLNTIIFPISEDLSGHTVSEIKGLT